MADAITVHARPADNFPAGVGALVTSINVVHTAAAFVPVPRGATHFILLPATNNIQFLGASGEAVVATAPRELTEWLAATTAASGAVGAYTVVAGEVGLTLPCGGYPNLRMQAVTGTCALTIIWLYSRAVPEA